MGFHNPTRRRGINVAAFSRTIPRWRSRSGLDQHAGIPAANDMKSPGIGLRRAAKRGTSTVVRPRFSLIRQKQWPIACFRAGSLKQFGGQSYADSASLTVCVRFQRLHSFWSGRCFSTEVSCQNAVPDIDFGVRHLNRGLRVKRHRSTCSVTEN